MRTRTPPPMYMTPGNLRIVVGGVITHGGGRETPTRGRVAKRIGPDGR